MRFRSDLLATILMSMLGVAAHAAPAYKVVDLGANMSAFGVNNLGQVVGNGIGPTGILWDGATGAIQATWEHIHWSKISDTGHIVGIRQEPSHLVQWHAGQFIDLGQSGLEVAGGVNNAGMVAGWDFSPFAAYTWKDGVRRSLHPEGASISAATDINNSNEIAGMVRFGDDMDAAVWRDSGLTLLEDLGGEGYANGINDRGQVVGYVSELGSMIRSAAVWNNGVLTVLSDVNSGSAEARGVNNRGEIIGSTDSGFTPMLWNAEGAHDLSSVTASAGLTCESAFNINDLGWIVGAARDDSFALHGVVLIPVPEPSGMALTVGSLLAAGGIARHRQKRAGVQSGGLTSMRGD